MHDLRKYYILSLNLEQPVMVLVLFSYVSAKLRNALSDFLRATEFTGFKRKPGPHFVQRLFFLINIFLNVMYLVCICICCVF